MADKKPGLSFLDKLTPEQWEMARLVGEAAAKAGVPPRLAISVAYKESRLGAIKADGSKGEIGIMQVMPDTGRTMGYSPQDLRVLEKNIEAGIKYLKMNLDQFEGNEGLAVAGYNAGPGRISNGIVPDSTRSYISELNSWGTFDQPAPKQGQEAAQPNATGQPAPPAAEADEEEIPADEMTGEVAPEHSLAPGEEIVPNLSEIRDADKAGFAMIGAGAGAGLGATVGAGKLGMAAAKKMGQMRAPSAHEIAAAVMRAGAAPQGGPASPLPTSAPGTPPAPPGAPSAPVGGPSAPAGAAPEGYAKATGPGSATYNWGRAFGLPEIEAAQALNTTKDPGGAQDLLNKRAAALQRIQTQFPSGSFAENPAYGGIMTPSASVGSGPRASFVVQPPEAPTPEAPAGRAGGLQSVPVTKPVPTVRLETKTAGALERLTRSLMEPFEKVGQSLAPVKPVVGALARVAAPAAAGYSIGQDVGDIYGEYNNRPEGYQPNKTNIGLSALGALGTGVSLVAPLSPLGLPLAIGAPVARYVKDRYQQIKANPKAYEETMQGALSNVDPMGAPMP
jgi:hypothetical protein